MNEYKVNDDISIKLELDDFTFQPTFTTNLIIQSVSKNISKDSSILDLGCGSGVVAIALSKISKFSHSFHASDISKTVEKVVSNNSKINQVDIEVKQSNLFSSWNRKFDYIVDDVSGISSKVADLSPWFKNISCESGVNGDLLTKKVLKNAPSYLKESGRLFFPVISLSNVALILKAAKNYFDNVELVLKKDWPLPEAMQSERNKLEKLKLNGYIDFQEKFGLLVASTSVYIAYN
tara:strand:+ start:612 stop:1316 length:705 start_codon:yes stop_codon:yes gene_type:complete